ncbi:MAG TPA: MFS transporter [Steroidobacteraceae bacterium]|jgi:MFS family permease
MRLAPAINSEAKIPSASDARAWGCVLICTLAYVFAYIDRQILSLLIQPIKHDLMLTATQFGLLSGLAFAVFYAILGIPIAALSDSRSRVNIIAAGLLVWSAATVTCGLARSFSQLFVARICVGAGEATISPTSYSLIADLFPMDRLGRALAVYSTGSFLGSGLGFLVSGWIVGVVGGPAHPSSPLPFHLAPWQLAFVAAGLPGIALAVLIPFVMRDTHRSRNRHSTEPRASFGHVLAFMRIRRSVITSLYLGFSFCAMSIFSLMAWAPAYLMRTFGLDARTTGYWLGGVVLVSCTAGVLISGGLIECLRRRGKLESPYLTGIIGAAGVIITATPLGFVERFDVAIALLAAATFFATFALPASTTAMQLVAPANMRARISAMFLFCNSLFGLALGAFLVGVLNDHVYSAISYSLTTVVVGASVIALVILVAGTPALRRALATSSQ